MTATSDDVNIVAIEKVNHENIGKLIAVGILLLCALETE